MACDVHTALYVRHSCVNNYGFLLSKVNIKYKPLLTVIFEWIKVFFLNFPNLTLQPVEQPRW